MAWLRWVLATLPVWLPLLQLGAAAFAPFCVGVNHEFGACVPDFAA